MYFPLIVLMRILTVLASTTISPISPKYSSSAFVVAICGNNTLEKPLVPTVYNNTA